ncbi:hypothetical protein [Corynebacterium phage LGCM-V6]|uniref:hypothetical protein n=1 Tax=Corynebacterium pseudotuberculosis TaxID=1719 RepID=UPI00069F0074|nr:hypothetical protein [Corynebacterium pseudotuberculosis]AQY55169.1 hypothetical protein LGCMVI_0041 [Corynebacterium phage LGCM-VI]ARM68573.1 hypothetical protein [Corynebacterium phage LGCM-V2]ARM68621.1 hypothetical protein [Corynebacterium phage LGCM-V3]ARM68670.1 hypothetical protein [Corynebacterium phage LGCM-V4]ARM68718.1 hypothetical protein [Corynebacterium phage LGCM-V6]ARM68766.1 hypothetical protein [Corynebacterium phage LGCM-V5]ARM68814.1 hypothetical protein [Corynebacteri
MPKITGKLETITNAPSAVREVWLRPPSTRPSGTGLIVDEPVRIIINEAGGFTATIAPGAAVLVLVGVDFIARESIPLLIADGMTTIAEAMEAARDFTPDVHDRLAELANEVARGVKSTGDSASAASVDRGRAEAAAQNAKSAQVAAAASEKQTLSAWKQVKSCLEEWEPRVQQLAKWQPQYDWLTGNLEKLVVQATQLVADGVKELTSVVKSDAEAAKRSSTEASQSNLKAQAAAKFAAEAATTAVTTAVNELKGNAPEAFDTLAEIAERIKPGGAIEAEILQKISEKADSGSMAVIKRQLEGLTVASIKGLAEALAGKSAKEHLHGSGAITDAVDPSQEASTRNKNKLVKLNTFGNLSAPSNPRRDTDAVPKKYVDDQVRTVTAQSKQIYEVMQQIPKHAPSSGEYAAKIVDGKLLVKNPQSGDEAASKDYVDRLVGSGMKIQRGNGTDPNTIYFEV